MSINLIDAQCGAAYRRPMMTPAQCRAARGLLGWSQQDLAAKAGVARSTVAEFEQGRLMPRRANMTAMREAMELEGVEFLDPDNGGPGVRFRP